MMIVVLRHKVQMIHETHGLLQSRMQLEICKESWLKILLRDPPNEFALCGIQPESSSNPGCCVLLHEFCDC